MIAKNFRSASGTHCPTDGLAVTSPPSDCAGAVQGKQSDRCAGGGSSRWANGGVGKRLLNVMETAQYLGLQVETVYKKARLRELPFVKVGRALRFDVEALGRFIEEHTVETID